jgi:hypothetical protein
VPLNEHDLHSYLSLECLSFVMYHFVTFWPAKFLSEWMEASHLYADSNGGLSNETKHISCSCQLTYTVRPSAGACKELTNDQYLHEGFIVID